MNIDHVLTPLEFYRLTLEQSNVKIAESSIEKTAAAIGVSPEVALIAQRFYEQLGLDGVKYATAKDRFDDSVEMAKAFTEHKSAVETQAMSDVDGLLCKVAEAVKLAVAENAALAGMPLSELMGIAALQQESAEIYEAAKTAEAVKEAKGDKAPAAPAAPATPATPAAPATPEAKPGWLERNKGLALPAAVIGGGALYALHKRREAKKKVQDAEAASALPVAK